MGVNLQRLNAANGAGVTNVFGGYVSRHSHTCRALIALEKYREGFPGSFKDSSRSSLSAKQVKMLEMYQAPIYSQECLTERLGEYYQTKCDGGEIGDWSITDVYPEYIGLNALETALRYREQYKGTMDIRVGTYSPLGFDSKDSPILEVVREGAKKAQFVVGLPERDNNSPIGWAGHVEACLEIGHINRIPVQLHLGQEPFHKKSDTEDALNIIQSHGPFKYRGLGVGSPMVYIVHGVSTASYGENRFWKFVKQLKKLAAQGILVGIIVCPAAALGMLQLRQHRTPGSNSIIRVLELLAAGIPVYVGIDNAQDNLMADPQTILMQREVNLLSLALRYSDLDDHIWEKLACGIQPTLDDRLEIIEYLRFCYNRWEMKFPSLIEDISLVA